MHLLILGDSVCWGQGLLPEHKFGTIVANGLGGDVESHAHSGAIIGVGVNETTKGLPGEIPISLPTILEQLDSCENPENVDVAIVNGGINDVDVRRILSPWTGVGELRALVEQHCGTHLSELLVQVGKKLSKPGAAVVVPGYYPILSPDSTHFGHPLQFQALLEMHGVTAGVTSIGVPFETGALAGPVVRNCLEFWHSSDEQMDTAVAAANAQCNGTPRFIFVRVPFKEENAVFASHPLLWGLDEFLNAQDEVRETRKPQCDAAFGDIADLGNLLECYRASAGHPNVEGAQVIASSILASLGKSPPAVRLETSRH